MPASLAPYVWALNGDELVAGALVASSTADACLQLPDGSFRVVGLDQLHTREFDAVQAALRRAQYHSAALQAQRQRYLDRLNTIADAALDDLDPAPVSQVAF